MVRLASIFRREAWYFPLDLLTFLWSALTWVIRWSVVTLAIYGAVFLVAGIGLTTREISGPDVLSMLFEWKKGLLFAIVGTFLIMGASGVLGSRSIRIPLPRRWSDAVDRLQAKLEAGLNAWGRQVDAYFAARISEPGMKIVRVFYLIVPAALILTALTWLTYGIPARNMPPLPPIEAPQGGPSHD